ncbi:unnamed protein product [Nezara viridula]|uniref:Neuropeptide n=1 Tax=Nezara viridula TaxID=85310 RepID=A0A9P0HQ72_NEZVI|nr:unnamed protein product [Nezara viridula]
MLFFKAVLACGFVAVVPTVSNQAVPSTSTSPIWNSSPSGSGKNIQDSFNYPTRWVSSAGNKIISDGIQRVADTGKTIAKPVISLVTIPFKIAGGFLKGVTSIGNNNYETIPGKKWVETTTKPWADNYHKTGETGTHKGSGYGNGGWNYPSSSGHPGTKLPSRPDQTGTGWTNGQHKGTDVTGNTVVAILPPATSTSGIGNNNHEIIPGKQWVQTTTKPWADNSHKTGETGTNKGSGYGNGGLNYPSNSGSTGTKLPSSPDQTGTGWTNGQQKGTDVAGNTVVAILPPATSTSGKTSISGEAASIDERKQKSD